MLSTYVGYLTGKQRWCDSSGAFLKWLRQRKCGIWKWRNSQPHARAKKISMHMHASKGGGGDGMNHKLKVRDNDENEIWPFDLTQALAETQHTGSDTAALGAASKGQISHSVVKKRKKMKENHSKVTTMKEWRAGSRKENLVQIPEHKTDTSALSSAAATQRDSRVSKKSSNSTWNIWARSRDFKQGDKLKQALCNFRRSTCYNACITLKKKQQQQQ